MFGNYFGSGFFGDGYWGPGTGAPPPTPDIKTGTGGIDPREGLRRSFKPTGLLDRPKAKTAAVQESLDESARIASEVASRLAREFGDESQRIGETEEAKDILEMSMAEVDREIGILLRKKLRTEEDEILLLLLMVAASA